ncbi:glutamate-5-semialdehyde dehydrogenase [Risungbinella massiliensis]|uniref:glutamate-5-semialdehyde dehydrogenase n=1 Tax=Risungbinella massiliensis TaxID=1329796 RepID=UPI0005CBBB96|nr:glutamate-5-semialdehyde dehydrogenase [Risungbinella massiliensis]
MSVETVRNQVREQASEAKSAAKKWASLSRESKDNALLAIADQLMQDESILLDENQRDMELAKQAGMPDSYLDRLLLSPVRIIELINSVRNIASLPDPVGDVVTSWTQPNGLKIAQTRVPIGVIGMIYEARPNVTVDAAAIALKTGNGIVLRGSRSALHSNTALTKSIQQALKSVGLAEQAVQYLTVADREAVDTLCTLNGLIDVIIPRGGAELIKRVVRTSTVPVLETGVGNCHIFVEKNGDYSMAEAIVINAKTSRPAVCNAAETLLIDEEWPVEYQKSLLNRLLQAGVQLRVCTKTARNHPELTTSFQQASEDDWHTEYLDLILAVRTVNGPDEAMRHINQYGTGHSEAIITHDDQVAQRFLNEVDAAAVYHNSSTRFTDGGEFGFGAEIGISTQKLHARGPMGLVALTSSKYVVTGNGQVR